MSDLVSLAYAVHARQIVNAPAWFGSERWDIQGLADQEGQPNITQLAEMVRKLLEDRFAMQSHREKRELAIYAITVAKGGTKLTPTASKALLPDQSAGTGGGQTNLRCTANSMDDFERSLRFFLERPVVNRTGLRDRYDFTLNWTSDPSYASRENAPPGFFTAVQEQLGLKVEPTKGLVDALVVDGAKFPETD